MATFATVIAISGRAWAREPNGTTTELRPGSIIPRDGEVITAAGASVTLAFDGAAPITIGEDRSVALAEVLAAPADTGEAVIRAEMTDSARLLAAIESGDDPFAIAEATAAIAGGPGGDDGGGSFVRLERISESVGALDLAYPAGAPRTEADLTRLSGAALADGAAPPVIGAPPEITVPPVNPPTPPVPPAPPVIARLQVLEDHNLSDNALNGATNDQGDPLSIAQFVVNGQFYNAGDTATITDASRPAKWQNVGTIKVDANGDYTFIPSADWNGTVPDITYLMTDGTDVSTDTLEIDVIPVNDQPTSLNTMYNASAAAGEFYVFSANDFPLRDDRDSDVNGVYIAPTEVVVASIPSYGGTLLLDGNPVVVGARVSLADLQAGKLVYQVHADYKGTSLLPFSFRVDDGGGTDNGGIAESEPYLFRLNVGRIIQGDNFSNSGGGIFSGDGLYGGFGKDIIIGDAGGVQQRQVDASADLNIALVLDRNAFTNEKFNRSDSPLTKAEALKNALSSLLNDQLLTHTGKVNLSLITFNGATSTTHTSVIDLDANGVAAILNVIDGLTGVINSQADYVWAFNAARAWFDDQMANGYKEYLNKTFFLTDSDANGNADDQLNAFSTLKQVSEVHAIDMGHHDFLHVKSPNDRIAQYDATDARMVADISRYTTHADFQNNAGANNINAWEVSSTGQGSAQIENGRMVITAESQGNYVQGGQPSSTVVTQQEAQKMVVTDPDGAYFSFRISDWNESYVDTFSWRLLKWDATANNGQGDWVVAETGGSATGVFLSTNETIMTSHQLPGDYRFQFEAQTSALWPASSNPALTPGRIQIDDIRIHKPVLEGSPQYVSDPDELSASLSINGTITNTVGDDMIETSLVGNSIVFGDALNTDGLPWGQNGAPPDAGGRYGLDALKYFLEASLGHAPTHAEIFDYIWTNHALFNVTGDTNGGNDFVQLGQWSSIAYGGGGNDTLYGGVGGDHILYGGAGDDYVRGGSGGGANTLIGGPGNDRLQADSGGGNTTFVWLDGDAGTVVNPAMDQVIGFSEDRSNFYGPHFHDTLDLRDLLIGEDANGADLTHYLNISFQTGNNNIPNATYINVSSTGNLQADGSNFDQQIRVDNIDLTGGFTTQQDIINALIQSGTLKVDQ